MRSIREQLLAKEQELRRLELKMKQEREAAELAEKMDPKRMVDAIKELAEKSKKLSCDTVFSADILS